MSVSKKVAPEVRREAETPDLENIEVIVEADLPPSKLQPPKDGRWVRGRVRLDAVDPANRDAALAALQEFLEKYDTDPVMLRSARAFVVKVDPSKLDEIADSLLVKRVSANRRL